MNLIIKSNYRKGFRKANSVNNTTLIGNRNSWQKETSYAKFILSRKGFKKRVVQGNREKIIEIVLIVH